MKSYLDCKIITESTTDSHATLSILYIDSMIFINQSSTLTFIRTYQTASPTHSLKNFLQIFFFSKYFSCNCFKTKIVFTAPQTSVFLYNYKVVQICYCQKIKTLRDLGSLPWSGKLNFKEAVSASDIFMKWK